MWECSQVSMCTMNMGGWRVEVGALRWAKHFAKRITAIRFLSVRAPKKNKLHCVPTTITLNTQWKTRKQNNSNFGEQVFLHLSYTPSVFVHSKRIQSVCACERRAVAAAAAFQFYVLLSFAGYKILFSYYECAVRAHAFHSEHFLLEWRNVPSS